MSRLLVGMLAVVLLWRLRFRHLGAWVPLLMALSGVLLVEPLASLLPGFWLSFAAVAVLVLCFAARLGAWRPWQAWTRAQWVIAVGLLPVLLALGLPVSLSAPLANLLDWARPEERPVTLFAGANHFFTGGLDRAVDQVLAHLRSVERPLG